MSAGGVGGVPTWVGLRGAREAAVTFTGCSVGVVECV